MRIVASRTHVVLALEITALAVLLLALFGVSWLDPRAMPRALLLIDRSSSMPESTTDSVVAEVLQAVKRVGRIDLQMMEFAGRPSASPGQASDRTALQPGSTNIERALQAALSAHAEKTYASVVVISDGRENAGDTARALRVAREARLRVQWFVVARRPPETYIVDVLAPFRATTGQTIRLEVQLAGDLRKPLRVVAAARDANGGSATASGEPDRSGKASLHFTTGQEGPVLVDLALEDAAAGARLDTRMNAAVIDVTAPAAVLYVEGSPGRLSRSLVQGGWRLNVVPAKRLDGYTARLSGYKAIVLDDVAVSDAGAPFWNALIGAVQNDGVGLLVLGGTRSFTQGGYSRSAFESVLPVLSEPAALDNTASVMFLVDKSGSMGQGSGGVDRFRLAQRAVVETARGLSERDFLGLAVFDVEPRLLIPLMPARTAIEVLAREWATSPRGGTKLAPALDIAVGELERSGQGRRVLVLVTDGFVEDRSIVQLRERLVRSHVETIALAIGPDADVTALQKLIGPETGLVLAVNEAAELPAIMRSQVERRRARVERGAIAVEQHDALPFAPAKLTSWPPITAYAVTRSRPDAAVPVQTQRGDPLIAFGTAGLGRVAAVTSGLGQWTPQWMQWADWPRFAGGLVSWLSGSPAGTLSVTASDLPEEIELDADARSAAAWAADAMSIAVRTPAADSRMVPADHIAPGRLRVRVPAVGAGLYQFVVSSTRGTQRLVHLRGARVEEETWGVNPALETWMRSGLIEPWNPAALSDVRESSRRREPDGWLIGVALVLFLAGVVIDRRDAISSIRTGLRRSRMP